MIGSIKGGNDRLPKALAAALGHRVRYRSEVVRIAQDSRGVTIGDRDRSGQHELRADRCVCALPFAPLRRVTIATPFSDAKMAAIHRLQYMAAARCYFQTRSRFWERDPLGRLGGLNLVGTDTMAGRVWNTSSQQADPRLGMVHAYMFDTEALEFAAHGHRRVGRHAPADPQAAARHPAARSSASPTRPGRRTGGPAAGGAGLSPASWPGCSRRCARAEGRVHFAGEHTSLWIAWMNGALESAERVVAEILHADGEPRRAAGLAGAAS